MAALPFELEQGIFENAANSDRRSALSLVLVARRVQFWVEPVVYKCVALKYGGSESARVLEGFISALKTRPASFFARYVKTLLLSDIPACYMMEILAVCTGLTDLRIWPHTPSPVTHFVVTSSIRPTHLSFSAEHLAARGRGPNFALPFYQELTHMELHDTWGQLMTWAPNFAMLPHLTHLALVFGSPFSCGSVASYGLNAILANCSKLKVCVLRCMLSEDELRFGQDAVIANSIVDPRVVVVGWHRSRARWADGLWNEKTDLWNKAEGLHRHTMM
ncbi:hypothetical protein DEU56DRAFT_858210 [Suillus clintonianus]|uniref:uncharacterized protein n=1 Tax=Suillus clintonianus TaxID=1904413 RepID=UPI001B876755|nr:uncharacterized protein DEU56DRAFT_858210 [Suillus clintonianus]KAG2135422.1 hypothetical protein DEU56DRAFT_858210 [Suillus clintonianus]